MFCYRVPVRVTYYAPINKELVWAPIITAESPEEARERAVELFQFRDGESVAGFPVELHDAKVHQLKFSGRANSRKLIAGIFGSTSEDFA